MQEMLENYNINKKNNSTNKASFQESGLFIRGLKKPQNCAECRLKACVLFEIENPNRGYSIPELYEFLNNDRSGRRYGNCPLEYVEGNQIK